MGGSWCGSVKMLMKVSRRERMTGGVFKSVVGGGVEDSWVGLGMGVMWYKAEMCVCTKHLSCWAKTCVGDRGTSTQSIMGWPKYENVICNVE